MDEQQKQNINQAAEQFTDSSQQVVRTLADRTVSLQESNLRLTQNFFQNWVEQVNNQAQGIREAAQNLQEQGQRQREAFETLSEEGTNAYSEFLNSALSFYQESLNAATQVGQQNLQQGAQATQQAAQAGVQAASQAAQQAARGGEHSARTGASAAESVATGVPIQDYDTLNVGKIVEQLDNLSIEELKRVRAYEQQNKNRDGLLQQLDRRINAAS
jgi:hypothetical protein